MRTLVYWSKNVESGEEISEANNHENKKIIDRDSIISFKLDEMIESNKEGEATMNSDKEVHETKVKLDEIIVKPLWLSVCARFFLSRPALTLYMDLGYLPYPLNITLNPSYGLKPYMWTWTLYVDLGYLPYPLNITLNPSCGLELYM